MSGFNANNLYLFSLIVPLFLYLTGLFVLYKHRKVILISSLLSLPQAFLGLLLVPVYWDPPKIALLGVGLEDFVFSFFAGGAVWMGIFVYLPKRINFRFSTPVILKRFLFCTIAGVFILFSLYHFDIKDIKNPYITMILISLLILAFRFTYLLIGVVGALSFTISYVLGLTIGFWIWPELISFWTLKNLSGLLFLQIPVEELIWAFLYGLSWSLGISYIFDIQINSVIKPITFL